MTETETTLTVGDAGPEPKPDAAASEAALAAEQAAFQRLKDGNTDPAPAPAEAKDEKPHLDHWMEDRLKRKNRQLDRERDRAADLDVKLGEAREIIEKLTEKLDPAKYESAEAYDAAVADVRAKRDKLHAKAPEASSPGDAAWQDVHDEVSRADPDLWSKVTAIEGEGEARRAVVNHVTEAMVVAIADAPDSAGTLRALAALTNDQRAEIAELSPRQQRKRVLGLQPITISTSSTEPAGRDPETGRFMPKVSEAPPPITPVASGGAGSPPPLDRVAKSEDIGEYIRRRETDGTRDDRFGWRR